MGSSLGPMGNDKPSPESFSIKEPQGGVTLFCPWMLCLDVIHEHLRHRDTSLGGRQPGDGRSWEMEGTSILGDIREPLSQPSLALNCLTMGYYISVLFKKA